MNSNSFLFSLAAGVGVGQFLMGILLFKDSFQLTVGRAVVGFVVCLVFGFVAKKVGFLS